MLKPKKSGPRRILQNRGSGLVRYCENPGCGARIYDRKKKHCDKICLQEHILIQKRERRPEKLICDGCGKEIDVMTKGPRDLARTELHFHDPICVDLYRRRTDFYKEAQKKGYDVVQTYKEKHGQVHNAKERAEATRKNNTTRPPRAKMRRSGRVWGYDVHILPNKERNGYIAYIPELPDIGVVEAKESKETLLLLRARFVEQRQPQAQQETPE